MGKILIVDSDFASRMQAIRVLMGAGHEVAIAEDTLEAGAAALDAPGLILLGDSMATASGFALVGRLFSTAETADIPVVILATGAEKSDEAMRSGARAVLTLPAGDEALLAIVAEHIDRPAALTRAPEAVLSDEFRLAAVEALRPDVSEQQALDRFTALASERLQVPISTITLLERDRQFVVSRVGIDAADVSKAAESLDYSYCQYAVTSRQPLRIVDSARHPLVRDNPSHTELGIGAYLGIPIITEDDQAVGALCAIDLEPRDWSDRDLELMNELAALLTDHFNQVRATPGRHSA